MYLILDCEGTVVGSVLSNAPQFSNILEVLKDAGYTIHFVHSDFDLAVS